MSFHKSLTLIQRIAWVSCHLQFFLASKNERHTILGIISPLPSHCHKNRPSSLSKSFTDFFGEHFGTYIPIILSVLHYNSTFYCYCSLSNQYDANSLLLDKFRHFMGNIQLFRTWKITTIPSNLLEKLFNAF